MARAVDVVRSLAPNARPNYLKAFENGDALLALHGITTPARLAHFLAQVLHESGGLKIDWENMNYSAERLVEVFGPGRHSACIGPVEAAELARDPERIAERVYGRGNRAFADKLGNTQPGDGYRYRGGGLMQTTGRENYRRMGEKAGVDFESDPALVLSPAHALKPALIEWTENRLNNYADNNDILSISRAINLGNAHSARMPNGMQSRMTWFAMAEEAIADLGFTPPLVADIPPAPAPAPAGPAEPAPPAAGVGIAAMLGDKELQMGDEGPVVRAVQLALAKLGYGLRGSGYFGGNTDTAVTDFQERHDLEVDGVVGPETAGALDAALAALDAPPPPVAPIVPPQPAEPPQPAPVTLATLVGDRMLETGDQGEVVRAVQLALARLGYGLKGTGVYGGRTEDAVTDFQQRQGIEVDGVVGEETAKALDAAIAALDGGAPPQPPAPPIDAGNRPLWLIEGLRWIGAKERPGAGSNPDILGWARGEGGEIAKAYSSDDIPWCALYANMVLTKVGIKGTETLWALDWNQWGRKLGGPAVGSFAPMKRNGGGHIAIVVGRDQHGNLMCLGGNQSDQVSIIPFPRTRPLSFRWPADADLPSIVGFDQLPEVRSDGHLSRRED